MFARRLANSCFLRTGRCALKAFLFIKMAHFFVKPGAGSPNTFVVHGVLPAEVK
jgi:hypothetical protein